MNGWVTASSESTSDPHTERMPPRIHANRTIGKLVRYCATLCGERKIPEPMMLPTVIAVAEFPFAASGVQAFEEGVIEMSGPGAEYSGCADRANLVLSFTPGRVTDNVDYDEEEGVMRIRHPRRDTYELRLARPHVEQKAPRKERA